MTEQPKIPLVLPRAAIQTAIRLEKIFMPDAYQQRREAGFSEEGTSPRTRFVHYTSAEAALNIIKTRQLWLRNATCMADFSELQHGLDILRKTFAEVVIRQPFIAALDRCSPGIASNVIELFDRRSTGIQSQTYIASVSEHDGKEDFFGRLSMWRAFGKGGARVGIVFRVPMFTSAAAALLIAFSPVAYLSESEVYNSFCKVISNIQTDSEYLAQLDPNLLSATVFSMFVGAAACLKHQGFCEEREWRVIYTPTVWQSTLMKSQYRVIDGVPQNVFELPLDVRESQLLADLDFSKIFDRLIIGPSPYPMVMKQAFVDALKAAGCTDAENRVVASDIPIRV